MLRRPRLLTLNAVPVTNAPRLVPNRQCAFRGYWVAGNVRWPVNRPIGAHFDSGGRKLSYLGEDLDEAFGEPEKPIANNTVWE